VEASVTELRRLRKAAARSERLQLLALLARPALLRQLRGNPLRRFSELAIELVVVRHALEHHDRVAVGGAVLEHEDRQAADSRVGVGCRQRVKERAVGVDVARVVPREELEREERGTAARRALVLEAAPEELELLAVAELPDRAVRQRTLAEIGAAGRALDLVLPLRPVRCELSLLAPVGQLGRLCGG
jgi:hypothetical protein